MNHVDTSSEFYNTWSKEYNIDCTGNCVVGDEIVFERAVFTGSWKKPSFSHMELIRGKIVKESYGEDKQQHTFTIETLEKKKMLIKGRNLYRNGTLRKPWVEESIRENSLLEKYKRGGIARENREERKKNSEKI